ncbi:MAG TPA: glycosyltransferase family 9 protein [Blastocatellia bacterium]|jgi:lipopolysaccharide heptosyltransferase I|nr:glycosyltransferase family 9 protein [Blastocatellia bacterium]
MRILIVKLSSIGDVVHTLPAVAFLRRSMPEARLSWVVERRASAILKGSPAIDDLIEIDTRALRRRPASRSTLEEIRDYSARLRGEGGREPVDLAIDFQGLIKSGLVTKMSGAIRRIGFETRELREPPSRLFLTEQIATSRITHVIDKNIALASAALAGSPSSGGDKPLAPPARLSPLYEFPIEVSPEDELHALEVTGERFAIVNPGGGWPTKLWPAERFGRVADGLWLEHGIPSLITYGPGEEDLARRVQAASETGAARAVNSTLKQFVALARRAELFVGGDTGPLHIAAASGTPIVGLYGPTSPERNGPFDPLDVTLGRDLWCRPGCHRRSCWHWECMDIPVSDVLSAITLRLARRSERAGLDPSSGRQGDSLSRLKNL